MNTFVLLTHIISILIALAVHEWAHAFVANKLGDPTAENEGRLTLNPIAHLDLMGTLLFVFVGFGWAKPVPVNPMYFKHPKRGMALTAVAGPFSNLVLATIAFTLLALFPALKEAILTQTNPFLTIIGQILHSSVLINLALMAFNLLPVPPLDGSNILRMFIPLRAEERYDEWLRIGPFVLLGLILVESILHIPLLSFWVGGIRDLVIYGLEAIANIF